MKNKTIALALCLMTLGYALPLFSQSPAYYLPINFKQAYEAGIRAPDGKPGKNYWQNRADYKIDVGLQPATRIVSGHETITYHNNSPDELPVLVFHLFPNLYKKGSARDFDIDHADASDGVIIEELNVNGRLLDPSPESAYVNYSDNNFTLILPEPLLPGNTLKIDMAWHYKLNENSHYREGVVGPNSFFVAYFFPRIAVYDDIDGWDTWKYSGTAEFYNDFGDFEVSVNVPENYFVWATGTWKNPDEHLKQKFLKRYTSAIGSDEITNIITKSDLPYSDVLSGSGEWLFEAENISDFAFGVSNNYLWDATSLEVDPKSGRRVNIYAAYNQKSDDFYEVCLIARKSIDFMSSHFPGIPYPYPKMTVFNGLSEMEFPMMVNDLSTANLSEAIKLTSHEIFHTYFPFYTGLNETKYAWMDEGLTSYGESLIATELDTVEYAGFYFMEAYKQYIGHDFDVPLFVNTEYLRGQPYYFNSYPKAATFFKMLHDILGDKVFKKSLHAFVDRWNGKHPTPYDLIFTFEDISGEDLSWFIRPWLFEYGYVDFELTNFESKNGSYQVTIEKVGHYPAPIDIKITYDDGSEEAIHKTAKIWKNGNKTYILEKKSDKKIIAVKLIDKLGLDADTSPDGF
ncbi:MAG: hypothetical protein B6D64_02160 [Bacteroidetes bacterium 4484_276]|nr:MAG: hypothetical protein B6D64_02160 [Bacteroidetes bacterium 4484_276]